MPTCRHAHATRHLDLQVGIDTCTCTCPHAHATRHLDLQVGIDKVFDLSDAVDGHKYLESGQSKGKVLYKL